MTKDPTKSYAGRAGGDRRGSAKDRRRRKQWMLETWGDGRSCPCTHCGAPLSFETVEADRIEPGGSYRRTNVQPSCRGCNLERGQHADYVFGVAAQMLVDVRMRKTGSENRDRIDEKEQRMSTDTQSATKTTPKTTKAPTKPKPRKQATETAAALKAKKAAEKTTKELVAAVKEHAQKRYDDGFGWDVVIEAMSDEEIAEVVGSAQLPKTAVAKMRKHLAPRAEAKAEAIAAGK